MATGRSDYPNQVNNVLGFPFIFRGALDVRASAINEEMKIAAAKALAELAKEDVPDSVLKAYGVHVDPLRARIPHPEAVRSSRAALGGAGGGPGGDGVRRGAQADRRHRGVPRIARADPRAIARSHAPDRPQGAGAPPQRIVFPEGDHPVVLRAARAIADQRIAKPVLVGDHAIAARRAPRARHRRVRDRRPAPRRCATCTPPSCSAARAQRA